LLLPDFGTVTWKLVPLTVTGRHRAELAMESHPQPDTARMATSKVTFKTPENQRSTLRPEGNS
jgi:hypothetical protein